jgi:hypothetical protein
MNVDSKYYDPSLRSAERKNLPLEAMMAAGWDMATDPQVANRQIVSMSAAYASGLFAEKGMPSTVLLGVHWRRMINNKRKRDDDKPVVETPAYGVYLTPNHKEPFYVWHTTSIEK